MSTQRRRAKANRNRVINMPKILCFNGCGEIGPHFVPPSLGDPGFWSCTPLEKKND